MKVAILMSGRINIDKNQYEHFYRNFQENNDVDLFISFPYKYNILLDEFIKLYKPKKYIISNEDYVNVDKYKLYFQSNRHNVMCMFLNRKKVLDIFNEYINENNIDVNNYDLIISMRCDLIFDTPIDLYKYIPYIKKDILIVPNTGNDFGGVDDRFALGNYMTISKYLNLYDNLIILLEKGNIIHPEMLTIKNLELQHVQLQKMPFNFDINRKLLIL
jgi:hypothetical protein